MFETIRAFLKLFRAQNFYSSNNFYSSFSLAQTLYRMLQIIEQKWYFLEADFVQIWSINQFKCIHSQQQLNVEDQSLNRCHWYRCFSIARDTALVFRSARRPIWISVTRNKWNSGIWRTNMLLLLNMLNHHNKQGNDLTNIWYNLCGVYLIYASIRLYIFVVIFWIKTTLHDHE